MQKVNKVSKNKKWLMKGKILQIIYQEKNCKYNYYVEGSNENYNNERRLQ